ncbi:MAG: chromosome partitioning protein ParB [Caulobacteraceae bacterium]|nr:chromosome partitioning protein ParB [Caulobacteraceae bacterium]
MSQSEPILHPVAVAELRPTQITVGFREVAEKRKEWRARAGEAAGEYLGRHMLPTVLGPKGRHYLVDHHHLALALRLEGAKHVLATVQADLRGLSKDSFWTYMDNRGWCHPYDAEGVRRDFKDIPPDADGLADDPYRSLAGALRRAGGFAKETTPFTEFLWADFLRSRVRRKQIESRFEAALVKAMELARTETASYLPGWCGPHPD